MSVIGENKAASRRLARPRLGALLRRWRSDRRGSALVEFAMVSPLLVALLVGSVEMASLIAGKSRAADAAMTIGDLVTKNKVMDEIRIAQLFAASGAVLEAGAFHAADGSKIEVTVTSALACPCSGDKTKLCFTSLWSHKYADGTVAEGYKSENKLPQMPSTLGFNPDETLVMTEVEYHYVAPVRFFLDSDKFDYEQVAFHRPRFSSRIEHTGKQAEASKRACPTDP